MISQRIRPPGSIGQWIVAIAACVCSLTAGQVFSWPSAALPHIIRGDAGFNLTDSEQSWMVTITFIGNVMSPIPAGYVMDTIGRWKTLLIFDTMMIVSWIIIYFSKEAWKLYVARLLAGIWAGIVYTVVPVFLGEVVEAHIRGTLGGIFGVMLYFGALYEIISNFGSYGLLTILSGIPPVMLLVALCFMPESPYFYLMEGKREQAESSIVWLRGECVAEDLDKIEDAVYEQLAQHGSFYDIFTSAATRRAFYITQIFGVVQGAAGVFLLFSYVTVILPGTWVSARQSFIVLCLAWIGSSFSTSLILDRFNRRLLMFISCMGSCISMIGISLWFYIYEKTTMDVSEVTWLPLFLLIIHGSFYSTGIVSIPNLLQGELFPVNVKAKASALYGITVSITSAITIRLYQPINYYVGDYLNFIICAISSLLGAVCTLTLMVETRGRTLEEIQQDLLKKTLKKKSKS